MPAGAAPTAAAEAEEGPGWSSMRTVAQMRRDLGIGAPRNMDSLYKPIERAPRQFNPLKIPRALQASGRLAKRGAWHGHVIAPSCLAPLLQSCGGQTSLLDAVWLEQPAQRLIRRPARLAPCAPDDALCLGVACPALSALVQSRKRPVSNGAAPAAKLCDNCCLRRRHMELCQERGVHEFPTPAG